MPIADYYPRLGNPIHGVISWSKVRSMIRALRAGKSLPPVYIDGEIGNCNMLSGTHRAAASEIRAELDGNPHPYHDLEVVDVSAILTDEIVEAWELDPEYGCEMIERTLSG